ncbi:VCBS repeat-containing protein [Arcticibacterium luteifluviistationis]|uniref:RNA-binding protein n=1 Tax=Arcticibacterium luteifluviistationis TaxID=1784714 RepID=A0A2Z4GCQ1_9BACT|nr:VCBS repeat-containing protein [Arcticibacterium luteifluviistationis]AWV98848.1 RNA-binding protein [Arcticibacterium luteifluviistationis]
MRGKYIIIGLTLLFGCKPAPEKRFQLISPEESGVLFSNDIIESETFNVLEFEYVYNGGGVGIGDFNKDGFQDMFFTGNQVSSQLYLNTGEELKFENVTETANVGTSAWCTGVTVVDINQDSWPDIYISVAGFVEDSMKRANLLFVNQSGVNGGELRFKEMAKEYGLDDMGYSTQTAFFDYDHDGDLDAYVLTNALEKYNRNALRPKKVNGEGASNDRLYRNNGAAQPLFENVSTEAGISTEGYGLGIAIADLNNDGWEDIYCSNDFLSNDLIWVNQQDGTFKNMAASYLKHQTHNAMGVDIADFNNDHLPDIMVVDMLPNTNLRQKMMLPGSNYERFKMDLKMGYQPQYMRNTLQMAQEGQLQWSEISQLAGVEKTDWSWAPLFADFDNDGQRDLFISNGYRRDVTNLDFTAYLQELHAGGFGDPTQKRKDAYKKLMNLPEVKIPNFCYQNKGNLAFEDVSESWGLNTPSFSNGAAYADFDNDGDLDLVVNNIDSPAGIYKNNSKENNWLRISLEHNLVQGSKLKVYADSLVQTAHFSPTRGFVSSVEPFLHFGLGKRNKVDSVEIIWPDGQCQTEKDISINKVYDVAYKPNERMKKEQTEAAPMFTELFKTDLDFTHFENEFNDFGRTPLLINKQSENGPPIAVKDADGNGMEDFFIGSDYGQKSYIFFQDQHGDFTNVEVPKEAYFEDTDALFFDADGDGDQDLYVVSGGSHLEGNSQAYQDRLYLNDGKGGFKWQKGLLPKMDVSGSAVVAIDFDQDGDLDIFRGSRCVSGQYPIPANSYLLENRGGVFKDITREQAPELVKMGLINDAVVADFNQDGLQDLAIAGEWMPLKILFGTKNSKGAYALSSKSDFDTKFPTGWWSSLAVADFDQDGDLDILAGNLGLNTNLKTAKYEPIEIYAADFDQNGSLDPIVTRYLHHEKWMLATRDILTFQIPSMKRRFPDYRKYAEARFEESFTKEEIQSAYHAEISELRTLYFENTGSAFVAHQLPIETQFSPIYGILIDDFNADGYSDALLVGNSTASETIGGWYDASSGTCLLNDKKGGFTLLKNSGFLANKEAKFIKKIKTKKDADLLLVGNNDARLQVFKRN